jgi:uncharacterized protein (DUF2267 family)
MRSEARADQTMHRFFNVIVEKTGFDSDNAVRLGTYVLGVIIQRIHYSGAANFIAQLPHNLQEELLDLPAGPDRRITPVTVLGEMLSQFSMDEPRARTALAQCGEAFEELIDHAELEHVRAQLPADFLDLVLPRKKVTLRVA